MTTGCIGCTFSVDYGTPSQANDEDFLSEIQLTVLSTNDKVYLMQDY
jgi:hypothetical protein